MTAGTLKPVEFALLLAAVTQSLPPGTVFTEPEINARLKAWLDGDGDLLRSDHAELRRALVDLQFVERDGYGRGYRRAASWPAHWAQLCAQADVLDLNGLIRASKARLADERAQRKARQAAA